MLNSPRNERGVIYTTYYRDYNLTFKPLVFFFFNLNKSEVTRVQLCGTGPVYFLENVDE